VQRRDNALEDIDVGRQTVDFIQLITNSFREKEEPQLFIEKFLFGKPVFQDHVDGEEIELTSYTEHGFSIWFFMNEGEDRMVTIQKAQFVAQRIELSRNKKLARVALYHSNPSRVEIIPSAAIERMSLPLAKAMTPLGHYGLDRGQQTAVIILDLEGQFKQYVEGLVSLTNKLHKELGSERVSQASFLNIPKNACLSYDELTPDDLTYFTPDLTAKSQDSFMTAIAHAKDGEPQSFNELMRLVDEEIEHGVRNAQIKQALTRTTTSLRRVFEELFDKDFVRPLIAEDLLVPGRITVVDVSELSEHDQRYVAIYLLTILHNRKMMENDQTRTVLILDEAHKMFPRKYPTQYKDFYKRIFDFVNEIVHKGRKRHYSVIIATQQPKDVAEMILNLPDTKVIFEVDGEQRWMSEMLNGKEHPTGVGIAYVVLKGPSIEPLPIRIPNVMGLLRGSPSNLPRLSELVIYGESQFAGYILQREKTPLTYNIGENQAYANIPQRYAPLAMAGVILVAKGPINGSIQSTTLFCEVEKIKAFEIRQFVPSKMDDGLKDTVHQGFDTTAILAVKREISSDGYDGPLRNQNYSNLKLYTPTEEEVRKCFNLPEFGFPLGEFTVSAVTQQKLTYFLPYNPHDFTPHSSDWQIDHSVLVVGSQGRGKTNFLMFLSTLLVAAAPEEIGQRIIRMAS
jgi:phosphoglycolate phosphatase-like HAD superfamily hydrolase